MRGKRGTQKRGSSEAAEVVIFDSACIREEETPSEGRASFLPPFCLLSGMVLTLCGGFVSAFQITPVWQLLISAIVPGSAFFTWFYLEKRLKGYRLLAGLLLTALYGGVCFALQTQLQNGFFRAAGLVARRINETYAGNLSVNSYGTDLDGTIFLIVLLFPLTGLLAAGLVPGQRLLPVAAVLFPVFALTAAAGGTPSFVWLYLLLLGVIFLAAAAQNRLPGWRAAAAAVLLAAVVSVPAGYLARPLGTLLASDFAKLVTRLETRIVQSLYQLLPRISGGRLQLSVDGIGGGVEDGTLGAVEGYYFTGMEALRVTSSERPAETVYLKGFVGQEYTGSGYLPGDSESFTHAAASWKTEGNASLYIQNLPFLRMMYYENYGGEETGAADGSGTSDHTVEGAGGGSGGVVSADENGASDRTAEGTGSGSGSTESTASEPAASAGMIQVENLNANTAYTYVPYYAFLNDYYQVCGGDGYVSGQTAQEDIFPCYWRSSYQEAMEAQRDAEGQEGVLDRTEDSYRAYCTQYDLQIPENGLERLKEECQEAAEENKWNQQTGGAGQPGWAAAEEIEEIRHYVQKTLLTRCTYELDVDALPEGEDFIEYFLYESQEGYSMHFAAAATMMFRMLGVPARYVVGYAAPKELFSPNETGGYTAILEDDNAHAWTEIYQPFLGWTPVEVTPGMEAELTGDYYMEETESESGTEKAADGTAEGDLQAAEGFRLRLPSWLNGRLDTVLFLVQFLLAAGAAGWLICHFHRLRRQRFGLGEAPGGRICALYISWHRLLVLAGMPEEYTIVEPELLQNWLLASPAALTEEEFERLHSLILCTHYGRRLPDEAEAAWMRALYLTTWKRVRKTLSFRQRLSWQLCG